MKEACMLLFAKKWLLNMPKSKCMYSSKEQLYSCNSRILQPLHKRTFTLILFVIINLFANRLYAQSNFNIVNYLRYSSLYSYSLCPLKGKNHISIFSRDLFDAAGNFNTIITYDYSNFGEIGVEYSDDIAKGNPVGDRSVDGFCNICFSPSIKRFPILPAIIANFDLARHSTAQIGTEERLLWTEFGYDLGAGLKTGRQNRFSTLIAATYSVSNLIALSSETLKSFRDLGMEIDGMRLMSSFAGRFSHNIIFDCQINYAPFKHHVNDRLGMGDGTNIGKNTYVDYVYHIFILDLRLRYGNTFYSFGIDNMAGKVYGSLLKYGYRFFNIGTGMQLGNHLPSFGFVFGSPYSNPANNGAYFGIELKYETGF